MRYISRTQPWLSIAFVAWLSVACNSVNHAPVTPQEESSVSVESADCRTLEHTAGATEICGQPQNVVVLGSNLLELLLVLDVQPAGFADRFPFHAGDYDNPAQQIPYLGQRITSQPANVGLVFAPSLEAIAKADPDLILGNAANGAQYEALSTIAPTLLFDWFDTAANLRAIATAVRRPERAAELLTETEQQVTAAQAEFAPAVAAHPQVLMLAANPQFNQFTLITSQNSFCGSLVADLGFELVYPPDLTQVELNQPTAISLETLPQLNEADTVILLGFNDQVNQLTDMNDFEQHQLKTLPQQWKENAIAQSLPASQADRVYFIPAYLCLGLPGPIGTELYLEELQEQLLSSD